MVSELTIEQVLSLQIEIGGMADGSRKGLLNQNLELSLKFQLRQLLIKLEPQIKLFHDMKNELIAKFSGGKESLDPVDEEGKTNTDYIKCLQEIGSLLSQTILVEHPIFKIEDFNFKSEENYPVFFLLIENGLVSQNGSEKKKSKSKEPKNI